MKYILHNKFIRSYKNYKTIPPIDEILMKS